MQPSDVGAARSMFIGSAGNGDGDTQLKTISKMDDEDNRQSSSDTMPFLSPLQDRCEIPAHEREAAGKLFVDGVNNRVKQHVDAPWMDGGWNVHRGGKEIEDTSSSAFQLPHAEWQHDGRRVGDGGAVSGGEWKGSRGLRNDENREQQAHQNSNNELHQNSNNALHQNSNNGLSLGDTAEGRNGVELRPELWSSDIETKRMIAGSSRRLHDERDRGNEYVVMHGGVESNSAPDVIQGVVSWLFPSPGATKSSPSSCLSHGQSAVSVGDTQVRELFPYGTDSHLQENAIKPLDLETASRLLQQRAARGILGGENVPQNNAVMGSDLRVMPGSPSEGRQVLQNFEEVDRSHVHESVDAALRQGGIHVQVQDSRFLHHTKQNQSTMQSVNPFRTTDPATAVGNRPPESPGGLAKFAAVVAGRAVVGPTTPVAGSGPFTS
uniref:Uncharacterized protein n=1 Tax=Lankesteria abbotti TaxID=340204 RepID=A0A7S2QQQ6_9APIC|mmetsp:Transcript_2011/g.2443  ORF Transcript_2011/g.2443 Transcript_2011/m.2443 type:complete len:436 (+) Transcript_2011:44-1351(+)